MTLRMANFDGWRTGVSRETPREPAPSVSRETSAVSPNGVSRETHERLEVFVGLLQRWNQRINLVSQTDEAHLWPRHIEDALQLIPLIPAGADHAIDLGSGGGFPGLVLAIATHVPFDLVESDYRKAAFLREAGRETGAPVTVHVQRAEHVALPPSPLITARALAPLPLLLALAARFMSEKSIALFPKGAGVDQELTDAAHAWNMRVERHESRIDRSGTILRISEVKRV